MAKIKLEDIQNEVAAEGWKVISTEYANLDTEMCFECTEGHRIFVPWKKIRTRRECPICKQNAALQAADTSKVIPKAKGAKRTLSLD